MEQTFEERVHVPDGDWTETRELTPAEFHEEQRNPDDDQHDEERNDKSS